MLSIVKLIAAAATLLAVLPSASATCVTQEISVYAGVLTPGWNSTNNLMSTIISPSTTSAWSNDQVNEDCMPVQNCPSTVVVEVTQETAFNRFFIFINGRYLLSNYSWSIQMYSTLPRASNMVNTLPSAIASQILWIDQITKISNAPNAPTFWTGRYWERSRPSVGSAYRSWQPIYHVPVPAGNIPGGMGNIWRCSNAAPGTVGTQLNYVQISSQIQNHCQDPATMISRRSCPIGIRGDPQFAGLRGQDYQIHGIDGAVYNIITAPALTVNSRFVWLDGPRDCPIMPSTGRKSVACWAHKGSYLDNLAIVNNAGAKILIESGDAKSGLANVEIDGKTVKLGQSVEFGNNEVLHYNSTHEVTLVAGLFSIVVENSDGFVNLRSVGIKAEDWEQLKNDDTHGLLGQTWRKTHSKKVIEGRVDDYLIESGQLFGSDFMYNRYQGKQE